MNIDKNSVVSFHYRLRDAAGVLLEDSHEHEPMLYLHGHGGIIPGLERAMSGRVPGDSFTVTVPPELAYGERREDTLVRVPHKHVLTKGRLEPGQVIAVNTQHGPRQVQVVKVGKFVVDVDTNHPLAGHALTFDIEIVDVRPATDEERQHGHAHGPDGHHHH